MVVLGLLLLELTACATARDVTRGTGSALSAVGLMAMALALSKDCDPEDGDECNGDYYDEETLDTRSALFAGGGAAFVVGGGLVAATAPGKKKRRRPPAPVIQPASQNTRPPETATDRAWRELIEGRCAPESTSVDLRVPPDPTLPRTLPKCGTAGN